jgi:SET and MYND domain-containing protein
MPIKPPPPVDLVNEIYSRLGNNNFVVHSHLTGVGHGVFPFTSRLFNHSCVPNAVAKYRFSQGRSVAGEIVALRDIHPDEEVKKKSVQTLL